MLVVVVVIEICCQRRLVVQIKRSKFKMASRKLNLLSPIFFCSERERRRQQKLSAKTNLLQWQAFCSLMPKPYQKIRASPGGYITLEAVWNFNKNNSKSIVFLRKSLNFMLQIIGKIIKFYEKRNTLPIVSKADHAGKEAHNHNTPNITIFSSFRETSGFQSRYICIVLFWTAAINHTTLILKISCCSSRLFEVYN